MVFCRWFNESLDSTLGFKEKLSPMIFDISRELRKRRSEGKLTSLREHKVLFRHRSGHLSICD